MLEYLIYTIFTVIMTWSLYTNYRLGKIVLKVEDEIERSLDILDGRFASINKILTIPLYYDSPEIRQVLRDIQETRNAILKIASSMGAAIDESNNDE